MTLRYDEPTKTSSLTISSAKRINQTLQEMLGGGRMVLPWYEPLQFKLFTAEPDDPHQRLNGDIVAIRRVGSSRSGGPPLTQEDDSATIVATIHSSSERTTSNSSSSGEN